MARVIYVACYPGDDDYESDDLHYFTSEKARQRWVDDEIDLARRLHRYITIEFWQLYPQPNGQMSQAGYRREKFPSEPYKRREPTALERSKDEMARIAYEKALFTVAKHGPVSGVPWSPPARYED